MPLLCCLRPAASGKYDEPGKPADALAGVAPVQAASHPAFKEAANPGGIRSRQVTSDGSPGMMPVQKTSIELGRSTGKTLTAISQNLTQPSSPLGSAAISRKARMNARGVSNAGASGLGSHNSTPPGSTNSINSAGLKHPKARASDNNGTGLTTPFAGHDSAPGGAPYRASQPGTTSGSPLAPNSTPRHTSAHASLQSVMQTGTQQGPGGVPVRVVAQPAPLQPVSSSDGHTTTHDSDHASARHTAPSHLPYSQQQHHTSSPASPEAATAAAAVAAVLTSPAQQQQNPQHASPRAAAAAQQQPVMLAPPAPAIQLQGVVTSQGIVSVQPVRASQHVQLPPLHHHDPAADLRAASAMSRATSHGIGIAGSVSDLSDPGEYEHYGPDSIDDLGFEGALADELGEAADVDMDVDDVAGHHALIVDEGVDSNTLDAGTLDGAGGGAGRLSHTGVMLSNGKCVIPDSVPRNPMYGLRSTSSCEGSQVGAPIKPLRAPGVQSPLATSGHHDELPPLPTQARAPAPLITPSLQSAAVLQAAGGVDPAVSADGAVRILEGLNHPAHELQQQEGPAQLYAQQPLHHPADAQQHLLSTQQQPGETDNEEAMKKVAQRLIQTAEDGPKVMAAVDGGVRRTSGEDLLTPSTPPAGSVRSHAPMSMAPTEDLERSDIASASPSSHHDMPGVSQAMVPSTNSVQSSPTNTDSGAAPLAMIATDLTTGVTAATDVIHTASSSSNGVAEQVSFDEGSLPSEPPTSPPTSPPIAPTAAAASPAAARQGAVAATKAAAGSPGSGSRPTTTTTTSPSSSAQTKASPATRSRITTSDLNKTTSSNGSVSRPVSGQVRSTSLRGLSNNGGAGGGGGGGGGGYQPQPPVSRTLNLTGASSAKPGRLSASGNPTASPPPPRSTSLVSGRLAAATASPAKPGATNTTAPPPRSQTLTRNTTPAAPAALSKVASAVSRTAASSAIKKTGTGAPGSGASSTGTPAASKVGSAAASARNSASGSMQGAAGAAAGGAASSGLATPVTGPSRSTSTSGAAGGPPPLISSPLTSCELPYGAWRLVRLQQSVRCDACAGTTPQETVDGTTEVFQCDQTLGANALAAIIYHKHTTAAAAAAASPGAAAAAAGSAPLQKPVYKAWTFCVDPLCLGSNPENSQLPKWPAKIQLGWGVKITRSEYTQIKELGLDVGAPQQPPGVAAAAAAAAAATAAQ